MKSIVFVCSTLLLIPWARRPNLLAAALFQTSLTLDDAAIVCTQGFCWFGNQGQNLLVPFGNILQRLVWLWTILALLTTDFVFYDVLSLSQQYCLMQQTLTSLGFGDTCLVGHWLVGGVDWTTASMGNVTIFRVGDWLGSCSACLCTLAHRPLPTAITLWFHLARFCSKHHFLYSLFHWLLLWDHDMVLELHLLE